MIIPLYPEHAAPLGAVFGAGLHDQQALEAQRAVIRDRYGLVEYSGVESVAAAMVILHARTGPYLPTLGIPASEFLPFLDPAEAARVAAAWSARLRACDRATGGDILVVRHVDESDGDVSQEQRVFERCGVTAAQAKKLRGRSAR